MLTDYQVVIVGVDDPMIAEWIENRQLVQADSGEIIDAESLASQIGLAKAIKDYDLKRIITFHGRVKKAEAFASEIKNSIKLTNEDCRLNDSIWTDYISGQMPAYKRRSKLQQLRELSGGDRGLLANARCLSEGVDVPSLDGVAFIDPRKSKVDIVQAVGRAIRLSDDKRLGTVILPVFIKDNDDAEASIEASNFKPIWNVLSALKAHDDVLSFELDQLRAELGRKRSLNRGGDGVSKIAFDLPENINPSFSNSLKTYLVEKTTSSWNFWFGLLEVYVEHVGHAKVPATFETADGFRLGGWVSKQRANKSSLDDSQIQRLQRVSKWSWDVSESHWEEGFSCLLDFVEQEGHSRATQSFNAKDGFRLGQWVSRQRMNRSKLDDSQIQRLEALPKWSWDALGDKKEEGLLRLLDFVEEEGHAKVPSRYKTKDSFKLGTWVSNKRKKLKFLSQEEISRLEMLPGWSWDLLADNWEEAFSCLIKFVEQEGHARVPGSFKTEQGFKLGQWVSSVRVRRNKLGKERIDRLEALEGWVWKVRK